MSAIVKADTLEFKMPVIIKVQLRKLSPFFSGKDITNIIPICPLMSRRWVDMVYSILQKGKSVNHTKTSSLSFILFLFLFFLFLLLLPALLVFLL